MESFKPLNTHGDQIWMEVLYLHDIPTNPAPKANVMFHPGRLCKFHKDKRYHTEDFYQLKK